MKRTISVLCCLILILTVFSAVPVSASGWERTELSEFPAVLSQKQIQESRLTRKLPEYDSYKNAVGYETADGTKTVFIFGEEIKYVDETGVLRDKDINVVPTDLFKRLAGYAYEVKSSDVKTYFPEKLTQQKGIKLVYQGHSIEMCPSVCPEEPAAARKAEKDAASDETVLDNVIQYDRAMDADTHIRLKTTYSGIKEDIILDRYTGTNRFSFIVDFGDLTPVEQNRGVAICDGEKALMKMPAAYVEDAESRFTVDNTIEVRPRADGKYDVTIVVDEVFLTDPDTVYPVIVDPSVLIQYYNHMDASVSSTYPNDHFGDVHLNCVGTDVSDGAWRFYVKFDLSALANVRYDNVISACYNCFDSHNNNSNSYQNSVVEAYIPFNSWTEDGITWNNKPSHHWERVCAVNLMGHVEENQGTYYDFYITTAVMAWLQGIPNYGLCFQERTDSGWRVFSSKEGDANLPYLNVSYEENESEVVQGLGIKDGAEYYIKCKRGAKYLTNNGDFAQSNVYQSDYTGADNQKWKLIYLNNGYYKIMPANSTSRCMDVYWGNTSPSGNTNEANIQLYGYNGGDNQQWKIVRNWNGTYRFLSKLSGNQKAMVVEQASSASGANVFLYTYTPSYVFNDDWTLEPVNLGIADFFTFTNDGGYGIDSTGCISNAIYYSLGIGFDPKSRINHDAYSAYEKMQEHTMWWFIGHGAAGRAKFHSFNGDSWNYSYIDAHRYDSNTATDYGINHLPDNALKQLHLAVFSSCRTGVNYLVNYNMVGNVFKKGAHYVIAYTRDAYGDAIETWVTTFLVSLNQNKIVYDAMLAADQAVYNSYGNNPAKFMQHHILGDGSIRFKH